MWCQFCCYNETDYKIDSKKLHIDGAENEYSVVSLTKLNGKTWHEEIFLLFDNYYKTGKVSDDYKLESTKIACLSNAGSCGGFQIIITFTILTFNFTFVSLLVSLLQLAIVPFLKIRFFSNSLVTKLT